MGVQVPDGVPWLLILALIPAVGAVVALLLPKDNSGLIKKVGLAFSLAALALTVYLALGFSASVEQPFDYSWSVPWIEAFGVSFALSVDGIALVLVAMTAVLVPVCILAGWNDAERSIEGASVRGLIALILLLETCVLLVFTATDVFLFYVFFEVMLFPMYFLIGRYGGPNRAYAATKFLLFSLVGGLFMLAAMIGLYVTSARLTGQGTFDFFALVDLDIDPTTQKMLFLGFFFAFAVKAPLWPFHTWLPDAAKEATPSSAVLLVAVLDKVGTFGMLRYCLPIFPEASKFYAPVVIAISLIGIIYGALLAIGQTDIKRLIAYTSVSHFGLITLGIFAMTYTGQTGSAFYMVNHGFSTAALFLIAGFLISRRGSSAIADFGGVNSVAPILAGTFLVAGLSSLALPGLGSFVSEFLVLNGTFLRYRWVGAVATIAIVLAAIYVLWLYQRVCTGPVEEKCADMPDANARESWVIAPLVAIMLALGFFPQVALDVINPAVEKTMISVGVTDPEPTVQLGAEGVGQ